MTYKIVYSKEASKALRHMPRNIALTILGKIETLALNPYAKNNNVKELKGVEGFRLRVGDWRILYQIHNNILQIYIVTIAPRGGAYR
jgi:mRNA interferase RelE/StbE